MPPKKLAVTRWATYPEKLLHPCNSMQNGKVDIQTAQHASLTTAPPALPPVN